MKDKAETRQAPPAQPTEPPLWGDSLLHTSQEMYRSVVDNIGIGVALISPGMEILTLNSQMRKWYPGLDVSGRPLCYQAFNNPPRDAICPYCPTYQTLQDGLVHESLTETPSGASIRNFRIISSPIRNHKEDVVAAVEMVEDITAQHQARQSLESSENMYRTLFENTGAATIVIEEDTTISLVNTMFERETGYTRGEVEGRMSWTKLFIQKDLDRTLSYHRTRRADPASAPRHYEIRIVDRGGKLRNVFITVDMIPETKRSIASIIDITDLRQAEKTLMAQKRDLENKTKRLEDMNAAMRVLLKQREEDIQEIEARVVTNIRELVLPHIEELKKTLKSDTFLNRVHALESSLQDVVSPFLRRLTLQYENLTPREMQIATLVRDGKVTKEISTLLNCSTRSVEYHRDNIRKKFGLTKSNANLRSYLLSLT